MEKIIRKDTLNEVFEIIDKHRSYHDNLLEDTSIKLEMAQVLLDDEEHSLIKEYKDDLTAHASALACLTMLELELRGVKEY